MSIVTERPIYWCIVVVPYDNSGPMIIARSTDATVDDLLEYSFLADNVDTKPMHGKVPGLYRLSLVHRDRETTIQAIETMATFPPIDQAGAPAANEGPVISDYPFIHRRMEEIRAAENRLAAH